MPIPESAVSRSETKKQHHKMATYYCPAVVQGSPLDFNEVAVLICLVQARLEEAEAGKKPRDTEDEKEFEKRRHF